MYRSLRRVSVLLVGSSVTAVAAIGTPEQPAHGTPAPPAPAPVIARDFADPDVLEASGTYYAYSTNSRYDSRLRNVPVAHAKSLTGPWSTDAPDALPKLPSWVAFDKPSQTYRVWAPGVTRLGDGRFLLYFTAKHTSGRQCIGTAVANRPAGPFTPVGDRQPLLCDQHIGGNIDASSLLVDGKRYLAYKNDSATKADPASIWIHRVGRDGRTPIGMRHKLLTARAGAEENNVVEAPLIVRRGHTFVLFYSANPLDSDYHVSYAKAANVTGPYTRGKRLADGRTWGIPNPGGQDVVTGASGAHLVFHGDVGGGRGMFVVPLNWSGDTPHVRPRNQP